MNEDRPIAEYGCAQQDLYSVANTVKQSYLEKLTQFTAHNEQYDLGYGTLLGTRINTARNLPEADARTAVHAILHTELQGLGVTVLVKWGQLETAIEKSFAADTVGQRLLEAGKGHYKGAYDEDWEATKGLLTASVSFVGTHAVALAAGGLPSGYAADLSTLQTDFEAKYDAFLQAEENTLAVTDAKINANNIVYRQVMDICTAGKKIFRLDAAVREQFIFESVLALVTGGGAKHTLSGLIRDKVTLVPIALAGVDVKRMMPDGGLQPVAVVKSDDTGHYKVPGLKKGKYLVRVEALGYVPEERVVIIVDGPVVEDFDLVAE